MIKLPSAKYSNALLKILVAVVLLLLSLHILFQYLNWEVYYQQNGRIYELANRFDFDDESSIPTWFSQLIFMCIGLGALLAAHLEKKKPVKQIWKIVGVVGLLFSLDEVAGLHEFLLQTIHNIFFKDQSPTSSDNAWLIVLPFIAVSGLWLTWKMIRLLPKRTIGIFVVASAVFLAGAIGVDLLTSLVERESFFHQGVLVAFEEYFEMMGAVIFLFALLEYIEVNKISELHQKIIGLGSKVKSGT
jgi:hypothetical protein